MHQKGLKRARKMRKIAKKVRKCEKVQNVNAMQKWNQNSPCIASHYCKKKKRIFAFFCIAFASHYHPCCLATFQDRVLNEIDQLVMFSS
jgi:hypothetical protein